MVTLMIAQAVDGLDGITKTEGGVILGVLGVLLLIVRQMGTQMERMMTKAGEQEEARMRLLTDATAEMQEQQHKRLAELLAESRRAEEARTNAHVMVLQEVTTNLRATAKELADVKRLSNGNGAKT